MAMGFYKPVEEGSSNFLTSYLEMWGFTCWFSFFSSLFLLKVHVYDWGPVDLSSGQWNRNNFKLIEVE